jgi:hypothetical protein
MDNQPKKSLRDLIKGANPEVLQALMEDEEMSEITLAGRMLWALIVTGKQDEELCKWAAEKTIELSIAVAPEQLGVLSEGVKKRLSEGKALDEIAAEMRNNSKEVWAAYTAHFTLFLAEHLINEKK